MALTKKLLKAAEPIVLSKTDFNDMDEYIAQLYDVDQLSLKEIEIHLNNVIAGTEKVHGRQLDMFGYRKGERDKQHRERRMKKDPEQLDLFAGLSESREPITEGFFDKLTYKRYKALVLSKLKYFGIKVEPENEHEVEEWVRDFYADSYDEIECAKAIRDNYKYAIAEDFSIGVGAPLGVDQGIPHSGDCKGVMPVRMQMVKSTGTKPDPKYAKPLKPQYWLNQIPKKKKKKKRKIRESKTNDFKQFCDEIVYRLGYGDELGKRIISKYMDDIIAEFETTWDIEKICAYIEKEQGMKLEGYSKEAYEYITNKHSISSNADSLSLNKYSRDQLNNLMEDTIKAVKSNDIVALFDVRKDAQKLKNELKNKEFDNKKKIIESFAKFMLATTYFGQNNLDQAKNCLYDIHENIENISHAIILKEHKKKEYFTILDEGALDTLKKIPNVLNMFKKKIDTAKQEGDKSELADAQEDIKDFKEEIYDKGILNKFRNNKGLAKAIFAAMAVLMLSAGASSAHAAATANANLGGNSHGASTMMSGMSFGDAMDNLDAELAKCKAEGNCNTTSEEKHVTGSSAGDGENTFSWHLNKQKATSDGGHVFMITIDVDNDGDFSDSDANNSKLVVHVDQNGNVDKATIHDHRGSDDFNAKAVKHMFPSFDKMVKSYM